MSLNITNLLTTLQQYYDAQKKGADKSDASKDNIDAALKSAYKLEGNWSTDIAKMEEAVSLNKDNDLTYKIDLGDGTSVKVSSEIEQNFNYKITEAKTLIIYGSNLTIDMPVGKENYVEVVGISNTINTQDKDDVVNIIGYGNIVKTGDNTEATEEIDAGQDIVNTIGGDTTSKEAEIINVFDNISEEESETFELNELGLSPSETKDVTTPTGKFTVTDDGIEINIEGKIYTINLNHDGEDEDTSEDEKITSVDVSYELKDNVITFTADNIEILAEDGQSDNIKIVGKNCKINTGDFDDQIQIKGDGNIVHAGEGIDTIIVDGLSNEINADEGEDEVEIISGKVKEINDAETITYTGNSATIVLQPDDEGQYVNVGGYEYFIERNPNGTQKTNENIEVSYTYNEKTGAFEFTGDNFIIKSQDTKDTPKNDNITIKGDNVYVDTNYGDDKITVYGDNGTVDGGEGNDKLTLFGTIEKASENILNIEEYGDTITLTSQNQWQTITVGDKTYTFSAAVELSTTTTNSKGETTTVENDPVTIEYTYDAETGVLTVIGNDVILKAGKGQEDNIVLEGNHSKIFALDKNDTITVKGDNNFIDGWTGDDKITVTGKNNKAYGFLGNDEININEDESYTDDEITTAKKSVGTTDNEGKTRTDEEITKLAKESLQKKYASTVDGEFGKDTVTSNSYYTDISADTEVFKSLKQKMIITPDDKEKEIVLDDGKTYIVKNYASDENPFTSNRTINYDIVDGQLVVTGDYIKVVAKDGQNDNVKIIGNNSYMNLGDLDDKLEVKGNYNLLFGGIGSDYLTVNGNNNEINGSDTSPDKVDKGTDTANITGENNTWANIDTFEGKEMSGETLTNDKRETTIELEGGKKYTIKVNIADDEIMTEDVQFTYNYETDENGNNILSITGNNLYIVAQKGQQDNIALYGMDCVVELGDMDDYIYTKGSNNKINGGEGDDTIETYGRNFELSGDEGTNTYNIVNSQDVTINANSNDKLIKSNNDKNSYGINDVTNKEAGIVILESDKDKGTIRYKDEDGDNVTLYLTPYKKINSQTGNTEIVNETILINYEVVALENGKKQMVISGDNINVGVDSNVTKAVNMKVVGSYNFIQTCGGDDVVDVKGDYNTINTLSGENTVNIEGNNNTANSGEKVDTFNVKGDDNTVIGSDEVIDTVNFVGQNNIYKVSSKLDPIAGSVTLTKNNVPYVLVADIKAGDTTHHRVYKLNFNGLNELGKEEGRNVEYFYDSEKQEVVFKCNDVSIYVDDELDTETTDGTSADEVTTDNRDSLRLIGNNCYIFSGFGNDTIRVEGDNNTLDGWYGDDSFVIESGDNNKVLGFDGDDNIIIDGGTGHSVDGEAGKDTLTIGKNGSMPEYTNIEVIEDRRKTEDTT